MAGHLCHAVIDPLQVVVGRKPALCLVDELIQFVFQGLIFVVLGQTLPDRILRVKVEGDVV